MARGPESGVRKKGLTWLRERYGGWWFKVHGSRFQTQGLPDVIGCTHGPCPHCGKEIDGLFAAIEFKRSDGKRGLTVRQFYILQQIEEAGGLVCVAKSVQDLQVVLEQHVEFKLVSPE